MKEEELAGTSFGPIFVMVRGGQLAAAARWLRCPGRPSDGYGNLFVLEL